MGKRTLFIVEGHNDEPDYIEQLIKKCFPNRFSDREFYVFNTNIHQLTSLVIRNGIVDEDIDLLLALKSREKDLSMREILSKSYNDVYIVFDFDPQDPRADFESVYVMLKYFIDSADMGRLFINYPMMQSYKHFVSLPDITFFDSVVSYEDVLHYKELVSKECLNELTQIHRYEYETFLSITVHHLLKAQRILPNVGREMSVENYFTIDYALLYAIQVEKWEASKKCFILNTSTFILIDYKPEAFFRRAIRHCTDYRLPEM